jgi:hypothetical protein
MSRPGLTHERLVALFILGALLFTPPFLSIFNTPTHVLGVPSLYFYLFAVWILLIVLVALVIESSDAEGDSARSPEPQPGSSQAANDETGP